MTQKKDRWKWKWEENDESKYEWGSRKNSVLCAFRAYACTIIGHLSIFIVTAYRKLAVCVEKMAFGDDFNVEGDQNSDRKTHILTQNYYRGKIKAVNKTKCKHAQTQTTIHCVTHAKHAFLPLKFKRQIATNWAFNLERKTKLATFQMMSNFIRNWVLCEFFKYHFEFEYLSFLNRFPWFSFAVHGNVERYKKVSGNK